MLKLSWQRLQNHLHLVANTARIGPSSFIEKGLNVCFDPKFEYRLPEKENGPFKLAVEEEKNFKEAVNLNKKAAGQFIQAFLTVSLLSKVNLQKRADKFFSSGRAWKMWKELQAEYNSDDSIEKPSQN